MGLSPALFTPVKRLPYPEVPVGILSFDFDGTLHDPESDPAVAVEFFEKIMRLRELGWIWGINTGRSQAQMKQGFMEVGFPFVPDFLVARERELYTPGEFGNWYPVEDWNRQVEKDHKRFFRKMKKPLQRIKEHVVCHTKAEWVEQEGDPAGLVASTEEEMAAICKVIDKEAECAPLLGYLRNSIYLRFSHKDYHKGSTLAEVTRRTGITAAGVLVAGDGHNDLDMLNRRYANWIICPSNAHADVQQVVVDEGGYVSRGHSSQGVLEALEHFFPE